MADDWGFAPTARMPMRLVPIRKLRIDEEASVIKVWSRTNADIESWYVVCTDEEWGFIRGALWAFGTAEMPYRGGWKL